MVAVGQEFASSLLDVLAQRLPCGFMEMSAWAAVSSRLIGAGGPFSEGAHSHGWQDGAGCWFLSTERLEHPHSIVAGFLQRKPSDRDGGGDFTTFHDLAFQVCILLSSIGPPGQPRFSVGGTTPRPEQQAVKLTGDHLAGWLPQPSSWGLSSLVREGRRLPLECVLVYLSGRESFPRNSQLDFPQDSLARFESHVCAPAAGEMGSWAPGRLPLLVRKKREESGHWLSKHLPQIANLLSTGDVCPTRVSKQPHSQNMGCH